MEVVVLELRSSRTSHQPCHAFPFYCTQGLGDVYLTDSPLGYGAVQETIVYDWGSWGFNFWLVVWNIFPYIGNNHAN